MQRLQFKVLLMTICSRVGYNWLEALTVLSNLIRFNNKQPVVKIFNWCDYIIIIRFLGFSWSASIYLVSEVDNDSRWNHRVRIPESNVFEMCTGANNQII